MVKPRFLLSTLLLIACAIFAPSVLLADTPATAPKLEAPSGDYVLDRAHSSITFRVLHLGLSFYTARFATFDAKLAFDAANPEKSSVVVDIKPASIQTDYPFPERTDFNKDLSTDARWFDTAKYPDANFTSREITRSGPTSFAVQGNLTVRGITRPVTLDAVLNGSLKAHPFSKRPMLGFSARTRIKRSDFGMTYLLPSIVADEVELIIESEFGNLSQQP